jgi:hypothetical protein
MTRPAGYGTRTGRAVAAAGGLLSWFTIRPSGRPARDILGWGTARNTAGGGR